MQVKNEIRVRVCWKCMIIDTLVSKKKEKKKNKHGQTVKNWERKLSVTYDLSLWRVSREVD